MIGSGRAVGHEASRARRRSAACRAPAKRDAPRDSSRPTRRRDRSRCAACRRRPSGATSTAATRSLPCAPAIDATRRRSAGRRRAPRAAARRRAPCPAARSTIAATSTPAPLQRERRRVRAVVVGEDDGARSGPHRVALDVGARGAGEHRSRQIVVRVGDAALVRAGREHDRLARAPSTAAGAASSRGGGATDDRRRARSAPTRLPS